MLHFLDVDAPILQPHERHPSRPDTLQFSVVIPTRDAVEVPQHVHVTSEPTTIIVITTSGAMYAYSPEGVLLQNGQLRIGAHGQTGPMSCFSDADSESGEPVLYVKMGPTVIKVSVASGIEQ